MDRKYWEQYIEEGEKTSMIGDIAKDFLKMVSLGVILVSMVLIVAAFAGAI